VRSRQNLDRSALRRGPLALLALALLGLALGAAVARRHFIRSWFRDAPPGPAPVLAQPGVAEAGGLSPVGQVRVMLLDGLDATTGRTLRALNGLCDAGLDLTVDVGFPTVSLPVQSVLWTGLTQQQSGLLYRIAPLPTPPPEAVTRLVPGSVAVSEDQPFIARSFGFRVEGPPAGAAKAGWLADGFGKAAVQAAAGPARLVFVHALRIDKGGHLEGTDWEGYRLAALTADRVLGQVLRAAPPNQDRRWLVLSDHGHRPQGGHGGAEPEVRRVRACLAGGGLAVDTRVRGQNVHLVDLARALRDSLGVPPARGSVGRQLAFAMAHPDPDATVPSAGRSRTAAAALLVLGALALGLSRRLEWPRLRQLPLWLPVSYVTLLFYRGLPTLSNPVIYPPLGLDILFVGAPGLVWLAVVLGACLLREPRQLPDLCRSQLALPAGAAAACLAACDGFPALFSTGAPPPLLLPLWNSHGSILLSWLSAAAVLTALAALIAALMARGRR
jgi:hypothetical protein